MDPTSPTSQQAKPDAAASGAPLFSLGQIVATRGAMALFADHAEVTPQDLVRRHVTGDFGELCAGDRQANLDAIRCGERILSAFTVAGVRCYVITEAVDDSGTRSATTVLLSSEY